MCGFLSRPATLARQHVAQQVIHDRITTIDADVVKERVAAKLQGPHHLAFLMAVLHCLHRNDGVALLANVFDALSDDGALFVWSLTLDDTRLAPDFAVNYSLALLNEYDAGQAHTFGEYEDWLKSAGFNAAEKVAENSFVAWKSKSGRHRGRVVIRSQV